ncbi:hypothetical protein Mapa_015414 [Marchantia paleacea]|nr:hypothetical protein Mapa_015414 [Marchantia paleacea]
MSAPIADTLSHEDSELHPDWLIPLLSTTFFKSCPAHGASGKSECNMYCLDCKSAALCSVCIPEHKDHYVVQVRRSSYHDVIRLNELAKVLDVTGVQTYIINSARVVFLNERPQPRPSKGVTNQCENCERSLLDLFRFCSLGCKLAGIRRNHDMTFVLQTRQSGSGADLDDLSSSSKKEKSKKSTGSSTPTSQPQPPQLTGTEASFEIEMHEEASSPKMRSLPAVSPSLVQSLNLDMSPRTPPPTTTLRTAKRRKGIPHRAPTV